MSDGRAGQWERARPSRRPMSGRGGRGGGGRGRLRWAAGGGAAMLAGGVLVGQGRAGGHGGDAATAGAVPAGAAPGPVPSQRFASGGLSRLGFGTGPGRCPRTGGPVPSAEGRTGRVPVSCSEPVPIGDDLGSKTPGSAPGRLRSRPRGLGVSPHGCPTPLRVRCKLPHLRAGAPC